MSHITTATDEACRILKNKSRNQSYVSVTLIEIKALNQNTRIVSTK